MSERATMNRHSRLGVLILMGLVAGAGVFSAGCAVASRTALPELPAIPVLTITTTTIPTPAFTNTAYVPPGGPGATIATSGGTGSVTACTAVAGTFSPSPTNTNGIPTRSEERRVGKECRL